ncbi:Major royal jelly protein [Sinomicrobium oceani]|uniref:Major royal jelly protein n=1 Tax=Sinomicrobium oceani TaxID=1150368 RepID=A0A1K1PX60_9FLAO|nr:L-dopachrome tautomerase-related protein [Sinomicrobium oceani]SFW51430.1 Major royal jelly protein [Sinomicrobium oceani]
MMKKTGISLIMAAIFTQVSAQEKFHSDALETVATFGKSMAIGLTVTSDNRIFVAFPDYNGDGKYTLTEQKDGKVIAYPDKKWNTRSGGKDHFLRVQDLYADAEDNLWVLDSKPASQGSVFGDKTEDTEGHFKLVKINTGKDRVERVYAFEDLDKSISGLNDVRVDIQKNMAYLSDPGQAAIVVLDLNTGKTRSVLRKTAFTTADAIVLNYRGREMRDSGGRPFSSHVNGIALTKDFRYFYFKPINKKNLYRIETRYLADPELPDTELRRNVEDMGAVGITHGLVADSRGNIFLTTSESYSITYRSPDGKLHTLVRDSRLLWPDSLGTGTDEYLYFTCAQLQRLPQWNEGEDRTEYPYAMYRVKLP